MYPKAIWKYFLDINFFNIVFSLTIGFVLDFFWSFILFCSFGILVGYLGFQLFKRQEYYTYYNLGYTKSLLLKKVWFLNFVISIPLFLIYLLIVRA